MEIVLLVILIVFVAMIYSKQSQLDHVLQDLRKDIFSLKYSEKQYEKPAEKVVERPIPAAPVLHTAPVIKEEPIKDAAPDPLIPVVIPEALVEEKSKVAQINDWEEFKRIANESLKTEKKKEHAPVMPATPVHTEKEHAPKNNDIEKFIGENLINKIGIAVLILGISFLVKYAIDNNWINEAGRVAIGFLCGAILSGFAHYLRERYRSFSSVLVAGGLTVFYFTTAFAFHQYHMWPQSITFAVMVIITIAAVALSLWYNRMELIIMATIGGFITPFLISNGSGNYVALFTYLIILNVGLLAVAFFKQWRIVHFIAFAFTQIIYGSWLINYSGIDSFPYKGALLFGSIFYCLFFAINITLQVSKQAQQKAVDYITLFSQNLVYYSSGMYILTEAHHSNYKGCFTAMLGLVNLVVTLIFLKNKKIDKLYTLLLTGISITYLTLAIPVQFDAQFVTLFWGMEMIILFWLYQRSFLKLFKAASLIMAALMLLSLFFNWLTVYSDEYDSYKVLLNKAFITGLFCAGTLLVFYRLLYKEADRFFLLELTNTLVRIIVSLFAILILFITGFAEVSYQFSNHFPTIGLYLIYQIIYCFGFMYLLFFVVRKHLSWITDAMITVIIAGGTILYIFQAQNLYNTFIKLMNSSTLHLHFIGIIAADALVLLTLWKLINALRKQLVTEGKEDDIFTYIVTAVITVLFSIMGEHIFIQIYHPSMDSLQYAENLYQKAGLTVIWSMVSFVIIRFGILHNYKPLRVSALALFAISLVKLFVYDISNIPPAGKIIAFILLGVVLLVVSFMYQKIKAIVLKEEEIKEEE